MWKVSISIKIIRVEGIDPSNLVTLIHSGEDAVEELSPYNIDKAYELPQRNTCRITLKNTLTRLSLSVSFNSRIFEEDGVQWLPLFKESNNDFLSSKPEEVASPRVLILIQKKVTLDVIKEGEEKSEIGSACDEDYMPEIKLCQSFVETNYASPFDDTYEQQSQEITELNNIEQMNLGIIDEINQELVNNVQRLTKLLEIERKGKEMVIKEMENMKNGFLLELAEAKKRESDIIQEYKEAEARCSASKFDLIRLKHEVKTLQAENSRLQHTLSSNEMTNQSKLEALHKKLSVFEDSQFECDKIMTRLSEVTGNPINSSEKLKEKDEIIKKLTREITEYRLKTPLIKPRSQGDELEEAVQRHAKVLKLVNPVIKDKEQSYIFNGKKISVMIKDGQLLCRSGGIFKPFDEFFNNLLSPETGHKIIKTPTESIKDSEERIRGKGSPTRKSNKSLTIGSRSSKRGISYS